MTQRTYSITLLPSGLQPVERTKTMPVLRLEFSFSPMTSDSRAQRIAGVHRREKAAGRIAEVGDRIERDVRHGFAEHDVEDEQIIDRRARIADRARESVRRLDRKARTEQPVVDRDVAHGDRARRRVPDHLADAEILEEIAGTVFDIVLTTMPDPELWSWRIHRAMIDVHSRASGT